MTQGSSAHRRLLKWMNQEEMRSFKESVWRKTGTHTLMDMPTHRVTKGSDVTPFPIMMAFYFFSNSRRTKQTNGLEAKGEKHFKESTKQSHFIPERVK